MGQRERRYDSCRQLNVRTHTRQKAGRRDVVDNNLLSTTKQFPFFTRETASRRQLKFFAFSCRQLSTKNRRCFLVVADIQLSIRNSCRQLIISSVEARSILS